MVKSILTPVKNERGALTIDFVFAFILVMGLAAILLALSLTLTVASVTQYITFASARNFNAAHRNVDSQNALANQKFDSLMALQTFAPLFNGTWFVVEKGIPTAAHTKPRMMLTDMEPEAFAGYGEGTTSGNTTFWGTYANFNAKMLDFKIPFFGSTTDNDDGFKTIIASYLSREPSSWECRKFMAEKWNAIRKLSVSGADNYETGGSGNFTLITDNGC